MSDPYTNIALLTPYLGILLEELSETSRKYISRALIRNDHHYITYLPNFSTVGDDGQTYPGRWEVGTFRRNDTLYDDEGNPVIVRDAVLVEEWMENPFHVAENNTDWFLDMDAPNLDYSNLLSNRELYPDILEPIPVPALGMVVNNVPVITRAFLTPHERCALVGIPTDQLFRDYYAWMVDLNLEVVSIWHRIGDVHPIKVAAGSLVNMISPAIILGLIPLGLDALSPGLMMSGESGGIHTRRPYDKR